jgi:hypothetical protein
LDLVTGSGQECAISQGDVLRVMSPPAPTADTATATILASKGGKECASAAIVSVGISDLQDMQNHIRETIDDGLKDLQAKQEARAGWTSRGSGCTLRSTHSSCACRRCPTP